MQAPFLGTPGRIKDTSWVIVLTLSFHIFSTGDECRFNEHWKQPNHERKNHPVRSYGNAAFEKMLRKSRSCKRTSFFLGRSKDPYEGVRAR